MAQKALPSYAGDFLVWSEVEKGLAPNSVHNYARFLQRFFDWLTERKLQSLTPAAFTDAHLTQYRLWLSRRPNRVRRAASGLHPSTQVRYLIALRSFLAYFHEKNIEALPTEKVKLPRERRARLVKFLDAERVKKLLEAPNAAIPSGRRDRAILETLFSTGLRVAELAALNRKQLEGAKGKSDFELSIVGKGGHPRTVYFSARALAALRHSLADRTDEDEALFTSERGGASERESRRLSVRGIELVVEKYSKMAGIPFLATPHTLRHSFATNLLNKGVDIRMVQEFLGHQNIATTQVYTHVTSKKLREIHKQFHGF